VKVDDILLETTKAEKNKQALVAVQKRKDEATSQKITVDTEIITDIEKKWQRKEKQLLLELDESANILREKHRVIEGLSAKVAEIEQDKYHPRMEYLEKIEKTMKNRLMDPMIAQEKLESAFICPRILLPFRTPITLHPCGHTFSKESVDTMREENFGVLKCDICGVVPTSTFRNEQVERILEKFEQRRELFNEFSEWYFLII
jgi:hypothetical protein